MEKATAAAAARPARSFWAPQSKLYLGLLISEKPVEGALVPGIKLSDLKQSARGKHPRIEKSLSVKRPLVAAGRVAVPHYASTSVPPIGVTLVHG